MTSSAIAVTLAHAAVLKFVISGLMLIFGARRFSGRVFLLGLGLAIVAGYVGPGWLPQ